MAVLSVELLFPSIVGVKRWPNVRLALATRWRHISTLQGRVSRQEPAEQMKSLHCKHARFVTQTRVWAAEGCILQALMMEWKPASPIQRCKNRQRSFPKLLLTVFPVLIKCCCLLLKWSSNVRAEGRRLKLTKETHNGEYAQRTDREDMWKWEERSLVPFLMSRTNWINPPSLEEGKGVEGIQS